MPTDQPSNAPDSIGTDAREGDTAAAVLHDDAPELNPGGGGMRGPAGADRLAGEGAAPRGTTPNAPIDIGMASPDDDTSAEAESRTEATQAPPTEPRPASR